MQPENGNGCVHFFDAARGYALFIADAYEGGLAWDRPSSPTLGTAALYGYRVATMGAEGDDPGRRVVVEYQRSSVRTYLVPWPGESDANFARRRSLAVYINLVEPIVDAYCDAIVPRVTRQLGPAAPYLANLDGDGQAWSEFVGDVALAAALDGVTAVVIDAPVSNPAANRAEEVELGIGLRATVIPLASWAWMRVDHDGELEEFAYADVPTIDETATTSQRVRIWVWTHEGCTVYESAIPAGSELGQARGAVLSGTPVRPLTPLHPALKGRLPVVFAYHRRVRRTRAPRGKSLAASPATISRQVYQLLSQVEDTQRRTPPFLAVPTKATNGLDPETQAKVGPDSALPVPADAGAPGWVTFPAESLQDLRAHATFLVGLAFRVSGLELQADASAQVQSGEALRVRSRDFEARATKFASNISAFERKALDLAALLLAAKREEITVTYPQRYVLGDPSELLAAAMLLMQSFGDRLGPEATTEATKQALNAALTLDESRLNELVDELVAKMSGAPAPPAQKELFAYDYDAGLVTVNEARATKGLGPIDGGEASVLEWAESIKARVAALSAPPTGA